jgi:hypothetical protein
MTLIGFNFTILGFFVQTDPFRNLKNIAKMISLLEMDFSRKLRSNAEQKQFIVEKAFFPSFQLL